MSWIKAVRENIRSRLGLLKELMAFLWENKMWWMIPMVVVLLLFGFLVFVASQSPVTPFIYTLF